MKKLLDTGCEAHEERRIGSAGRGLRLLALALVASCSSGGGGDEEEEPPLPEMLTFSLATGVGPLTLESGVEDLEIDLTLAGLLDLTTDGWNNEAPTEFMLDSGVLFGELEVSLFLPLQGATWDQPMSGTIDIEQISTGDVITVVVNLGAGGVDIFYDDGGDGLGVLGPFTYTWLELLDLFDASMADYERIASLTWTVVERIRERFLMVFEVFAAVFELTDFLEGIGPGARVEIPNACGSLPGSGTFGDGIFIWNDDSGDGLVGPGDSISVELDQCWVDAPGIVDQLYNGTFELTNITYTETPFATGADVSFTGLTESVTVEAGGMYVIVPGADTTTRGDATVFFDE